MEASVSIPRPINRTAPWIKLKLLGLYRQIVPVNMREAHQTGPVGQARAATFSVRTLHAFYDYSRQQVDALAIRWLLDLAEAAGLRGKIEAMFRGDKINVTEDRAVLHTALRQQPDTSVFVDGEDVIPGVKAVQRKIQQFTAEIHDGTRSGVTGKRIKTVVAIGIGGSYLGPEYLAEACKAYRKEGMELRFVANVDGTDFAQKTADLNAETTLFIIISKTFTTPETMKNAGAAKAWALEQLPGQDSAEVIRKHFVAVSTAKEKVEAFGIDANNMFEFWDWVGGRYSATSAVGLLPLSLLLGWERVREILEGAYWMDEHFRYADFRQNIPVMAALIDVWNINFLGIRVRALLPYAQALLKLAPHTQQVEMESNGKGKDLFGRVVRYFTGEVVFGEPGTNGQHSFYQLIHQGMKVAADFIGFIRPQHEVGEETGREVSHHQELSANWLAQPDALAFGKTAEEARKELVRTGILGTEQVDALVPHKVFTGNRPSSTLLLAELTPFTAGLLLAFTEHRTAVKGFIWGINSFDQWGVELGKALGVKIRALFLKHNATPTSVFTEEDGVCASTATMLNAVTAGQLP